MPYQKNGYASVAGWIAIGRRMECYSFLKGMESILKWLCREHKSEEFTLKFA